MNRVLLDQQASVLSNELPGFPKNHFDYGIKRVIYDLQLIDTWLTDEHVFCFFPISSLSFQVNFDVHFR